MAAGNVEVSEYEAASEAAKLRTPDSREGKYVAGFNQVTNP